MSQDVISASYVLCNLVTIAFLYLLLTYSCPYKVLRLFFVYSFIDTVKPRYSVFQGTGQNYALYRGSLYCQYINNYENTS